MRYRPRKHGLRRTPLALLALAVAMEIAVYPAEAQDQARPKVAEAKVLEAGTAELFRALDRKIERREYFLFDDPTAGALPCNDEDAMQIKPAHCETGWNFQTKD
jgi:hypothetical protein